MRRLLLLLFLATTGCMATKTTTNYKDGAIESVIIDKRPFLFNKGVKLDATMIGLDLKAVDPNTGNPAPSANINFGDTGAETIPLTTGGDNITEIFGTYTETLEYSKSLWGAELGTLEYHISAGGIGVLAIDGGTKSEKIEALLKRISEIKKLSDME